MVKPKVTFFEQIVASKNSQRICSLFVTEAKLPIKFNKPKYPQRKPCTDKKNTKLFHHFSKYRLFLDNSFPKYSPFTAIFSLIYSEKILFPYIILLRLLLHLLIEKNISLYFWIVDIVVIIKIRWRCSPNIASEIFWRVPQNINYQSHRIGGQLTAGS